MKFHIGDLVWLKWEDHYGTPSGGWKEPSAYDIGPYICETVGWVVRQDKGRIATGHSMAPDGAIAGGISVCPKRMILDYKILKRKK